MRGFQMCELMQRHGSGRFSCHMLRIPKFHLAGLDRIWVRTCRSDAIYIFVKNAIDRLSLPALALLQARAAMVVHDPVDRPLSTTPGTHVDLHLASSLEQEVRLRRQVGPLASVGLLLHQPDLRLPENPATPTDRLRPAYFGDPANAVLCDDIVKRVAVFDVGLAKDMAARLSRFAEANIHYAVRPEDQISDSDVIKPLTKAMIAARCGVPIMVNRAAHDAEALLGQDFPYLVDNSDPDTILAALDRAATDFAGPRWKDARDRMHALASRVHPAQTARDLETVLEMAL